LRFPFFGRGWCAVCPIPLPGEWLQRGAVLAPPGKKTEVVESTLAPSTSKYLATKYFFPFTCVIQQCAAQPHRISQGLFWQPLLFAAIGLSIVFERRSFCRYLCPVGGFIGLYSQTAPLELRIKDKQVCAACEGKPCYNGSADGYGCPWDVFPGGLTKNTYCGLCMECLRTCPHDNIVVNARPFSEDLAKPSASMDEAFKAFIMLGSAMIYAGVLLGPWGTLKDAAYSVGTSSWFIYAVVFLAIIFVVMPALFALCVTGLKNINVFKKTLCYPLNSPHSSRLDVLGGIQSIVRADQCQLYSRFAL